MDLVVTTMSNRISVTGLVARKRPANSVFVNLRVITAPILMPPRELEAEQYESSKLGYANQFSLNGNAITKLNQHIIEF